MSASKRTLRRSIGPVLHNSSAVEVMAVDVAQSRSGNSAGGDSPSVGGARPPLMSINDDNAERRERRHHRKLRELQKQNVPSPSRIDVPITGGGSAGVLTSNFADRVSATELSVHYKNCIKLSSENKITTKNAFDLHLIDCFADMLKNKNSEMDNFQVVGCTLDASAKIYGCRVDCVHADAQKIASGLSRTWTATDKRQLDGDDSDTAMAVDDDHDPDGGTQRKKQKKANKRTNTIEKNLNHLNVRKSADHRSEINPLFRKTTELFKDGGSGGAVLLGVLSCRNDSGELVLDSIDSLESEAANAEKSNDIPSATPIDIAQFSTIFKNVATGKLHVCPGFVDFDFNQWKPGDAVELNWDFDDNSTQFADILRDNINEERDEYVGVGDDVFESAHMDEDANDRPAIPDIPDIVIEQPTTERRDAAAAALVNATQGLAVERNEYSYFKKDFASAWAGPNHWHIGRLSKGVLTTNVKGGPKPRAKKTAFRLQYSEDVTDAAFERSNGTTRLTRDTRRKWIYDNTTLFEDIHYDPVNLHKLFFKESVMIRSKTMLLDQSADADLQNYDYENRNDVENFCPATDVTDNNGRLSALSGSDNPFSPPTPRGFAESNLDFDTQLGASQGAAVVEQHTGMAFTGDNLVQQPRKVAAFEVPYIKTANRVNVRHVKESILKMLRKGNRREELVSKDSASTPDESRWEQSFCEMFSRLPTLLSAENAKNLSFAMAFVCTLHIANEKNLELVPQKDLKDFKIILPDEDGGSVKISSN